MGITARGSWERLGLPNEYILLRNLYLLHAALTNKGAALYHLGRYAEAVVAWQEARVSFARVGDHQRAALVARNLKRAEEKLAGLVSETKPETVLRSEPVLVLAR